MSEAPQPGETITATVTLETAGGASARNAPSASELVTVSPSAVYFTADNYSSKAVVQVSRSAPFAQIMLRRDHGLAVVRAPMRASLGFERAESGEKIEGGQRGGKGGK